VEFQIKAMRAVERLSCKLAAPLLAVDFVDDGGDEPVAIDLNTAPGIAGTPVEHELPGVGVNAAVMAQAIAGRWREVSRAR
jgi:D-alanine-D-alanine ligase-like ATP-grasp enzyme